MFSFNFRCCKVCAKVLGESCGGKSMWKTFLFTIIVKTVSWISQAYKNSKTETHAMLVQKNYLEFNFCNYLNLELKG